MKTLNGLITVGAPHSDERRFHANLICERCLSTWLADYNRLTESSWSYPMPRATDRIQHMKHCYVCEEFKIVLAVLTPILS